MNVGDEVTWTNYKGKGGKVVSISCHSGIIRELVELIFESNRNKCGDA